MVGRIRRVIRRPGDVALAARMVWFVARAPADLERRDVPQFLDRLRHARRPAALDPAASRRRVARLRHAVLSLPGFRSRNTCYMRALTMYRFLDAGDGVLRLHIGVEERADPSQRLHGHAWVTLDDVVLEEGPETVGRPMREVDLGRSR